MKETIEMPFGVIIHYQYVIQHKANKNCPVSNSCLFVTGQSEIQ